MLIRIIVIAVISYLLGNLNGAILISKHVDHDDVRTHGSGNAGMTNYFRNYGGSSTLLVIAVDFGKALAAALLGRILLTPYGLGLEGTVLAGLSVVLGHNFPALLNFKGGKGIMCSFAVSFVIGWQAALLLAVVFALFYFSTWYVSLGSVMAALSLLIAAPFWYASRPLAAAGIAAMALLAIYMHRTNIVRLWKHEERKTNFFKREK